MTGYPPPTYPPPSYPQPSGYGYPPTALPYGATQPTNVLGRRSLAFIIDSAIALAIMLIMFVALASTRDFATNSQATNYCKDVNDNTNSFCQESGATAYVLDGSELGAIMLAVGGYLVVNFVLLTGLTGFSFGKGITGVRVVAEQTGQRCGIGRALVRTLLLIVPDICGVVGFIVAATNPKHRRVGDMAASTLVVDRKAMGRPLGAPANGYGVPAYGAPSYPPMGAYPPAPPSGQYPPSPYPPSPYPPSPYPPAPSFPSPASPYPAPAPPTPPPSPPPAPVPAPGAAPFPVPGSTAAPPPEPAPAPAPNELRWPESSGWTVPVKDPAPTPASTPAISRPDTPAAPARQAAPVDPDATTVFDPAPTTEMAINPGARSAPSTPREPAPGTPGFGAPHWDTGRNTYIQWDPELKAWMQWDTAGSEWRPLR